MMLNKLPLQKISTVDATVNFIKKQIEEGSLRPGEQLPSERNMQKLLNVSRFTLREALAKLSALGIVEITHGKGSFVTEEMKMASLGDVFLPLFMGTSATKTIDFFEARMIIESETVKLCAERRTKNDLKNLKDILDKSIKKFGPEFEKNLKDTRTGELAPFLIMLGRKEISSVRGDLNTKVMDGDEISILEPVGGGI